MHSERAKNEAEAMSGAVPDKVCPAYGQGAPELQTGSRGGSEISFIDHTAAPFELSATNSNLHTASMDGRATCANSCPWQLRQVLFSNGPGTTDGA